MTRSTSRVSAIGGKGRSDSDHAGQFGNIVAICDIDANRLGKKGEQYPKAKQYADFRKLLEEMGKGIDAVTVSTPDHTHAPASIMAMRMGKHVYCQKPLTHTVAEARLMRETARKQKVATQMGNQGTAASGFRQGIEIIQSGAIGDIEEVHVWTNRPFQVLEAGAGHRRPPEGHAAGAGARELGFVPRPGSVSSISSGVSPARLAGMVGLRHGLAGRHGVPYVEFGIREFEIGNADAGIGNQRGSESGDVPGMGDDHVRVSEARKVAAGEVDMVRGGEGREAESAERGFACKAKRRRAAGCCSSGRRVGCFRRMITGRSKSCCRQRTSRITSRRCRQSRAWTTPWGRT